MFVVIEISRPIQWRPFIYRWESLGGGFSLIWLCFAISFFRGTFTRLLRQYTSLHDVVRAMLLRESAAGDE